MQSIRDEVWASIPSNTGRIRPRTSALVVCLAIVLAAALGGVAAGERSGTFQPQLSTGLGGGLEFVDASGATRVAFLNAEPTAVVRFSFGLKNTGWSELRVHNVAVGGDGLQFVRALAGSMHPTATGFASGPWTLSPADPFYLAPGDADGPFAVEVQITDCRVVGSPDVVVTVDSWRGVQTVSLPMPRFRHNGLGWSVATADDPEGIGATRYLADLVCGVGECGPQLCHRDTIGTGRRSTFGVSARTGGFAVRAMIRTCGWSSARRGGDVKGRTFRRKIDSP